MRATECLRVKWWACMKGHSSAHGGEGYTMRQGRDENEHMKLYVRLGCKVARGGRCHRSSVKHVRMRMEKRGHCRLSVDESEKGVGVRQGKNSAPLQHESAHFIQDLTCLVANGCVSHNSRQAPCSSARGGALSRILCCLGMRWDIGSCTREADSTQRESAHHAMHCRQTRRVARAAAVTHVGSGAAA